MIRFLVVLLALLAPAFAARAETPERIVGRAVVLDGDTIEIDGRRVRLWGIDTAEMKDRPAGPLARAALDDLVAGWTVACEVRDTDRYKRAVAICGTPEAPDLSLALLKAGQAIVFRTYTAGWPEAAAYDDAERLARMTHAGFWGDGGKVKPDDLITTLQRLTVPIGAALAILTLMSNYILQFFRHRHDRGVRRQEEENKKRKAAAAAAVIIQPIFVNLLVIRQRIIHEIAFIDRYVEHHNLKEDDEIDIFEDINELTVPEVSQELQTILLDAPLEIALAVRSFVDGIAMSRTVSLDKNQKAFDRVKAAIIIEPLIGEAAKRAYEACAAAAHYSKTGQIITVDIPEALNEILSMEPEDVLKWCDERDFELDNIQSAWAFLIAGKIPHD